MGGRILLVEEQLGLRALLKAKLMTAQYEVVVCDTLADVRRTMIECAPDLALIGLGEGQRIALEVIRDLKSDPKLRRTEIVALVRKSGCCITAEILEAGADDVLDRSMPERVLMARIRNMMRLHIAEAQLRPAVGEDEVLGFSDMQAAFDATGASRNGIVALVTADTETALFWKSQLAPHLRDRIEVLGPNALQEAERLGLEPDIYVISLDLLRSGDGLTMIADLRSRSEGRYAGIIAVTHPMDTKGMVTALDLGAGDVIEEPVHPMELAQRLRNQLRRKARIDSLRQQISAGLKLAVTDSLTGLKNRRYALSTLARIADDAERTGNPFAVMVLDLDHFKRVNDTFGHAAGDAVLAEAARRISGALRSADLVARLGGEEFLVVMPDTTTEEAAAAGERLRKLIAAVPFALPGSTEPLGMTISVGVAMGGQRMQIDTIVDRADKALYSAKADGRNLVTLSAQSAA